MNQDLIVTYALNFAYTMLRAVMYAAGCFLAWRAFDWMDRVDIRKETVASFEAPERCRPMAAGSTPQEHNGNGAPNNAARDTAAKPLPPTQRCIVPSEI